MSNSYEWFLDLSDKITTSIAARTNEAITTVFQETEGFDGLDVSFVQIGYAFLPDPISPQSYIARGPYANPASYKEQMDASVERGWLEVVGEDRYALTEKSRKWAKNFLALGDQFFGDLPMLLEGETERLVSLLTQFVRQASQMPGVGALPTLQIGLKLEPGPDAHLMTRLRRKITDVFYFRDDVHIMAWQPYGMDGKTWEVLTQVWRGEASTAVDLAESLSAYRYYTEGDYAVALDDLTSKGWIVPEGDKFIATEKGKQLRQEAEDRTDQLFYTPLQYFSESERVELKNLMEKLAEVLAVSDVEPAAG